MKSTHRVLTAQFIRIKLQLKESTHIYIYISYSLKKNKTLGYSSLTLLSNFRLILDQTVRLLINFMNGGGGFFPFCSFAPDSITSAAQTNTKLPPKLFACF